MLKVDLKLESLSHPGRAFNDIEILGHDVSQGWVRADHGKQFGINKAFIGVAILADINAAIGIAFVTSQPMF